MNGSRPTSTCWSGTRTSRTYYRVAEDVIGELVDVCQPRRFFHIGMDEDHWRSVGQYVDAIKVLRGLVRKHGLRSIIWNDSCHFAPENCQQVHADKSRDAEKLLPKDVLHVLWHYGRAYAPIVNRLRKQGFDVWPRREPSRSWSRNGAARS